MNGQLATSPSFLQSVLSRNAVAELSELHVIIKEFEKSIQLLTVQVYEDIAGRYINFDKFGSSDDDDYLHITLKLIQDLKDTSVRIADGQNQADDKSSTQEFQGLCDALQGLRSAIMLIYQLLSIDCALKSMIRASEKKELLEAAECYSKISPMFLEITESGTHLDALKKECNIHWKLLTTSLINQWKKIVSWLETGESLSSKTKTVTLKLLKDQEPNVADTLTALCYTGSLELTLSTFGKSLLHLILFPILRELTTVVRKDNMGHIDLTVQISRSKETPDLSLVLTNLKEVFRFLNEEMNIDLGSGVTTLRSLGALFSNDFSKALFKECLNGSGGKLENGNSIYDVLDELRELDEYLSESGFWHRDYLSQYIAELTTASDQNPAFWECARFLEKARLIMKEDINDTSLIQQESMDRVRINHPNRSLQTDDQKVEYVLRGSSIAFPTCRVSKWIVKLANLLKEILTAESEEQNCNQRLELFKTARRIVDLYAAFVPVHDRGVLEVPPLSIALFYNNTDFLAHQLVILRFDDAVREHSDKMQLTDLTQHLRSIAVMYFLKYVQKQRTSLVENTKQIDLLNLNDFQERVDQSILQLDQLRLAWKGVLPATNYAKAVGGILDSWLEELIKLFSHDLRIPENAARNIKLVLGDIARMIPSLFEGPADLGVYVSRLSMFEVLIDILDSTLSEVNSKWANGSLAREFGPHHVQQFVRVLFGHLPGCSQVLLHIKVVSVIANLLSVASSNRSRFAPQDSQITRVCITGSIIEAPFRYRCYNPSMNELLTHSLFLPEQVLAHLTVLMNPFARQVNQLRHLNLNHRR